MRNVTVTLAVLLVATVGVAPAPALGHRESSVSCAYDESRLEAYQPETVIDHLAVTPTASYAAVYSSPERPTDVYVYFLRYTHQKGVTAVDSHPDDHEPIYVVVDDRTGDVRRVSFSTSHYVKETGTPSTLPMNGSHAKFRVVAPWHQYVPTPESGSRVRLKNYCAAVERWHANGWDASVEATTDPWTMRHRDSWWAEDSVGASIAERYWDVRRSLGDAVSDRNVSLPARQPRRKRTG